MIYLYAIVIITFIVILLLYIVIRKKVNRDKDVIESFTNKNIDINIANMYINDDNRNTLMIKKIYDAYVDDASNHGNYQHKSKIDLLESALYKNRTIKPQYDSILQGISEFGDKLDTIVTTKKKQKDPEFRDINELTYIPDDVEQIRILPTTLPPLDYNTSPCNTNSMLYSEFKNDICNTYTDINKRNEMCAKLSKDNCAIPSCCVLVNGTKCRAGDITGPKISVPDQQYYEYNNICYGNCTQNSSLIKECGKYSPTSTSVSKKCMLQLFNNAGCPNTSPDTIINDTTVYNYKKTTLRMIQREIKTSVDLLKEFDDTISNNICNGTSKNSTEISDQSLWERYGWVKPTTYTQVATDATDKFKEYVDVSEPRTRETVVKVIIQDYPSNVHLDDFKKWVISGSKLVARSFSYPPISTFLEVIAFDGSFVYQTYLDNGYTRREATDRMNHFDDTTASAFGGSATNTFNAGKIIKSLSSKEDVMGIKQTIGHEFFHSVQERKMQFVAEPSGKQVPQWFIEGSATFIGLQTASKLGWIDSDYLTYGRKWAIDRIKNSDITNRSLLIDAISNTGKSDDIDPYGIGAIAVEFLISNIGMIRYMAIYEPPFESFSKSFKNACGVNLTDFYTMFEEIREVLGIKRAE